jgi:putative SOS response-associated peptidase YedK
MRTRYVLLKEHLREILAQLGIDGDADFSSRNNIGPGRLVPAVRIDPAARTSKLATLRWGLVPASAKSDESAATHERARPR